MMLYMNHRSVADAIKYCITAILYTRQLYDYEYFISWDWNGQQVYEIFEPQAETYLNNLVAAIKTYLVAQTWVRVVLVLYTPCFKPIERWEFNVRESRTENKAVENQLRALMLNVKSTSTYTQTLNINYTFKAFIYVDPELERLPQLNLSNDPTLDHPNGFRQTFLGLQGSYTMGVKFEASDD